MKDSPTRERCATPGFDGGQAHSSRRVPFRRRAVSGGASGCLRRLRAACARLRGQPVRAGAVACGTGGQQSDPVAGVTPARGAPWRSRRGLRLLAAHRGGPGGGDASSRRTVAVPAGVTPARGAPWRSRRGLRLPPGCVFATATQWECCNWPGRPAGRTCAQAQPAAPSCISASCPSASCLSASCISASCISASCISASCISASCPSASCLSASCPSASCPRTRSPCGPRSTACGRCPACRRACRCALRRSRAGPG